MKKIASTLFLASTILSLSVNTFAAASVIGGSKPVGSGNSAIGSSTDLSAYNLANGAFSTTCNNLTTSSKSFSVTKCRISSGSSITQTLYLPRVSSSTTCTGWAQGTVLMTGTDGSKQTKSFGSLSSSTNTLTWTGLTPGVGYTFTFTAYVAGTLTTGSMQVTTSGR